MSAVELASARLRITGLEEALRPFAEAVVLGSSYAPPGSEPGESYAVRTRQDLGPAFTAARQIMREPPSALATGVALHVWINTQRAVMTEAVWGELHRQAGQLIFAVDRDAGTCSIDETIDVGALVEAALLAVMLGVVPLTFGAKSRPCPEVPDASLLPICRGSVEVGTFWFRNADLDDDPAGGMTIEGATIKGIVRKSEALKVAGDILASHDRVRAGGRSPITPRDAAERTAKILERADRAAFPNEVAAVSRDAVALLRDMASPATHPAFYRGPLSEDFGERYDATRRNDKE